MIMKTAICTQIKNSKRYIKEWADWHLAQGISKIYLFEDYDSESHKDIFEGYKDVIVQSLEDYGIPKAVKCAQSQLELQQKFCKTENFDWVLCIDDDEFLMFEDGYNLKKLLEEFKDYKGIWLGWKPYNANGYIERPEGGLMENYTQVSPCRVDGGRFDKKSFVNLNKKGNFSDTHHVCDGGVNVDFTKNKDSKPIWKKAWLNHYFTKSFEDYCERVFNRGNMTNENRNFDHFFDQNPDMINRAPELLESIRYRNIDDITYISKKYKIIAGGNVNRLKELQNKYIK